MGGAACAQHMVLEPDGVMSTEYVRAPEVFLGVTRCGPAVDLWAIGIVGCALLCGSTIFWRPLAYELERVGFVPRREGDDAWRSILANQAVVMGPLSAAAWPECEDCTAWSQVKDVVSRTSLYSGIAAAVADVALVRRPVNSASHAATLLSEWLRWDPQLRLRARESLDSPFFTASAFQPPPLVMAALQSVSNDTLRSAVCQSFWAGTPVDLAALSQGTLVHGGGIAAEVEAETIAARASHSVPPRRVRLRLKTNVHASAGTHTGVSPLSPRGKATPASSQGESKASSQCACHGHCGSTKCRRNQAKRGRGGSVDRICRRPALPAARLRAKQLLSASFAPTAGSTTTVATVGGA